MKSPLSLLDEYEGHLAKGVHREELIACAEEIPLLPHAMLSMTHPSLRCRCIG